jgi:hypothetical protein
MLWDTADIYKSEKPTQYMILEFDNTTRQGNTVSIITTDNMRNRELND